MIESFLADVATDALSDFAKAAVIAGAKCDVSDIIVEVAAKSRRPIVANSRCNKRGD